MLSYIESYIYRKLFINFLKTFETAGKTLTGR